ncbi:MAG: hypothetical protein WC358_07630 [Ignavibacteria bacterium]|jgi:hypothetical protein
MMALVVFCATTFASECINCVCTSQQESKKEMKCCSTKKVKSCCNKEENKCESQKKKDCDNCMKCVVKKNDIENPVNTNDNKISNSKILQISDVSLSLNPVNSGMLSFNTWQPPDKTCKIFLALSNFRI